MPIFLKGLGDKQRIDIIYRLTNTIHFFTTVILFLAPNQLPQNITVISQNSTVLRVCFYPPPSVNQNGPLTLFNISYSGHPLDTLTQRMSVSVYPEVYPLTNMLCCNLTNLQEYNNYTLRVKAVNTNGDGPESDGVVGQTDEAG